MVNDLKANKMTIIILVAILMASAATAVGVSLVERRISSQGRIKAINVEVFSDAACTQVLTAIDWGLLEPSQVVSRTVYLKNVGNTPLTLSMSTSTWAPSSAASYISVNWNAGGKVINPSTTLGANITLSVSSAIGGIDSFSFYIVITGSG